MGDGDAKAPELRAVQQAKGDDMMPMPSRVPDSTCRHQPSTEDVPPSTEEGDRVDEQVADKAVDRAAMADQEAAKGAPSGEPADDRCRPQEVGRGEHLHPTEPAGRGSDPEAELEPKTSFADAKFLLTKKNKET